MKVNDDNLRFLKRNVRWEGEGVVRQLQGQHHLNFCGHLRRVLRHISFQESNSFQAISLIFRERDARRKADRLLCTSVSETRTYPIGGEEERASERERERAREREPASAR